MRTTFKPGYALALVGLLGLGIGTIAWTGNGRQQVQQQSKDTIPAERRKSARETDKKYQKDFDRQLDELDKALKELNNASLIDHKKIQAEVAASLKEVQREMEKHQLDMAKFEQELKQSLKEFNSEKIQKEMQQALKELDKVDMEKIKKEVQESLKDINTEKMRKDIQQSLKEMEKIDMGKAMAEVKKSMEEFKSEDFRKQMEEMKLDMARVKDEIEKSNFDFKVDLQKAREDVLRAKEEVKGYQQMVEEMEKDGLINTREDYKIQFKNKELYINNKKQSAQVSDKYRKYFKKDTTIQKESGNMNINSHDDDENKKESA